ncbi:MAG: carbohydrate ABC transporter permease [Caldilineaceae bacterium]
MKTNTRLVVLFLLPAGLLYLAFFLFPAGWAFYFSLFNWSGFSEAKTFVGLRNYTRLLTSDPLFWRSLFNTLRILIVGGVAVFTLSFLLAVMLNSIARGKKFFRALIFMPNVIAVIALTTLWAFAIYSPTTGIVPRTFEALGIERAANFLWMSVDHSFWSMLIAIVWIETGFYVVLLLAGMDKIPMEYYEAARLEGANLWHQFWRITLPLMWDVVTIAVVLWTISAIKVFEFPYAFMGPTSDSNLYTVGVYLYVMGFGKRDPIYQLGYATAIGVMMLALVVVSSLVIRRAMRREVVQY